MQKVLLIALFVIPVLCNAQKIKQYKAPNGITYHLKDTVKLNKGMAADSTFAHIQQGGIGFGSTHNLPGYYLHTGVVIKNIKTIADRGQTRTMFAIDEGGVFPYSIDIDAAIAACEVIPCAPVLPVTPAVAQTAVVQPVPVNAPTKVTPVILSPAPVITQPQTTVSQPAAATVKTVDVLKPVTTTAPPVVPIAAPAAVIVKTPPAVTGEATKKPVPLIADELVKLKKLLDAGVLTQAEFDAQKKKLLAQ